VALPAPVAAGAMFHWRAFEVASGHPARGIAAYCIRLHRNSIAAILKATIRADFSNTEILGMKSDATRQLFFERYTAGICYADLCRELRISRRTASNWVREMGLPQRRGGPRRQRWMPDKKPKID
jgi:hypothetical protein